MTKEIIVILTGVSVVINLYLIAMLLIKKRSGKHLLPAITSYQTSRFLELGIKDHKRGYRWTVSDDEDLICMGTNYHKNIALAEDEAVRYFCKPWALSEGAVETDD